MNVEGLGRVKTALSILDEAVRSSPSGREGEGERARLLHLKRRLLDRAVGAIEDDLDTMAAVDDDS